MIQDRIHTAFFHLLFRVLNMKWTLSKMVLTPCHCTNCIYHHCANFIYPNCTHFIYPILLLVFTPLYFLYLPHCTSCIYPIVLLVFTPILLLCIHICLCIDSDIAHIEIKTQGVPVLTVIFCLGETFETLDLH